MSNILKSLRACIVIVLLCSLVGAQSTNSSNTVVPMLVQFSGVATDGNGKPLTGIVGVTFSLYQEQQGGAPLWIETQNVQPSATGHYSVMLGSSTSQGLPANLFASGEARWLGVQVQGQAEQPRVMLLSVPYALKAGDAQTVGGLPATAFVLASPSASGGASSAAASPASGSGPNVGGSGTEDYIPLWTDNNGDLGNSILYQLGTGSTAKIGINETKPLFTLDVNGTELVRGLFEMATQNYANKNKGYDSQPLNFESSAFNSGTGTYTFNHFQWQAEPVGNDTTTPGATLNLLYGTDPASPTETGLKLSSTGLFTFAAGQTFPGTGTITGITTASGSGLSGGGTSGNLNLSLVNTCSANQVLRWNGSAWACASAGNGTITGVTAGTDLTGGGTSGTVTLNVDTTKVPQLAAANTFTANNLFQPSSSVDAIDAYTSGPGKTALVGIEYASSGGSYGAYSITYDLSGAGAAGIDRSGFGTGVYGYGAEGGYFVGSPVNNGSGPAAIVGQGAANIQYNGETGGLFYGGQGATGNLGGDGIFALAGNPQPSNAGYFGGNVTIDGNLSKSGGSFKIDHPLDPANKYLYHSFVESPDMMNIYNGNVTTDAEGNAVVELPEWFEVLNRDFRYQLTVMGQFAQAIVSEKVKNHQFSIKTDKPNVEVSWQVTGIRQDAWANAHRIPVEQEKTGRERGSYLHPELFGAPPEKSIAWALHPEALKKMSAPRPKPIAPKNLLPVEAGPSAHH
jgi:trimeric autotransporter adhesin